MSYILEALKKSEQERTLGAAPTLHAIHAEPFFHRAQFSFRHYGVVAAVLAVSALALWHRPAPMGRDEAKGADLPALTAMESPVSPRTTQPAAVAPTASRPSMVESREPPAPVSQKTRHHERSHGTDAAKLVQSPPPEATPPQEVSSPKPQEESAGTPPRKETVEVSELPAAVQRGMPKLAISGYINNTDDPSGRMVGIGDQLVREGDEVSPGLKLEKIGSNSAVFAYKGYHFRVHLP